MHRKKLVKHIDALAARVLSTAKDQFVNVEKADEILDERVNNIQPRLTRCISAVLELQENKNSITTLQGLNSLKDEMEELANMELNLKPSMKKIALRFYPSSLSSLSSEILFGKVCKDKGYILPGSFHYVRR